VVEWVFAQGKPKTSKIAFEELMDIA